MDSSKKVNPSQNCSSLFGAPTEQMVCSSESKIAPASFPTVPTCPKVEGQTPQVYEEEAAPPYYDEKEEELRERWRKHPLNRSVGFGKTENKWNRGVFDFQRYIELKDCVFKWSQKLKKLPSRKAPKSLKMRRMFTKKGDSFEVEEPYQTFYSDKREDENAHYYEGFSITDYDERTHYKFTYGNMEAALHMTKYIWKRCLKYKKQKDNWKWVIFPTCYEFLSDLQTELNGYTEEFMNHFRSEVEDRREDYDRWDDELLTPAEKELQEDVQKVEQILERAEEHELEEEPMEVVEEFKPQTRPFAQCAMQTIEEEDYKECMKMEIAEEIAAPKRHKAISEITRSWQRRMPYVGDFPNMDDWPTFLQWKDMRMNIVRNRFERTQRARVGRWDRLPSKAVCNRIFVPKAHAEASADVIQKEENVVFSDQRETIQDTGYIQGQIQVSGQGQTMAEDNWTYMNMLRKPLPFINIDWTTGDEKGTEKFSKTVPGDTMLANHAIAAGQFVFFRGYPKLRFQVNGTKFHSGRLMIVFIPRYSKKKNDNLLFDYNSMVTMPHIMLDASFSNSGILELPWVHGEQYFNAHNMREWQSLGTIKAIVFNKLQASTGSSTQISVTGWISYENCELHQPKPFSTPKFPKEVQSAPKAHAESLLTSIAPAAASLIADSIPKIGNVAGGNQNQDKPTDAVEIQRWVPNTVTSLAYGDGIDRSSRLGLKPTGFSVSTVDIISTTRDDMNLLELCKIPCRIADFEWSQAKPDRAILGRVSVTPTFSLNHDTSSTPQKFVLPICGYIARAFKYWRGSMRYKIQVIASQMHSGRLAIAYCPTNVNITKFEDAIQTNMYIIDLQEKNEVEFVVDFMCEKMWLRSDRCTNQVESEGEETQQQLGSLAIFVQNRLVHPNNVASTVDVNVFVSAGDDFRLAIPSDIMCVDYIGKTPSSYVPKVPLPKAQSLNTQETVTTREQSGSVSMSKGSSRVADPSAETMGEDCTDLKTLLRRYTAVYEVSTSDKTRLLMRWPNSPHLAAVARFYEDKNGLQTRSLLSHFSELYTYWRGSIRYKLIMLEQSDDQMHEKGFVTVYHIPGVFSPPKFNHTTASDNEELMMMHASNYGTLLGSFKIQASMEFEVPFYTPLTQLEVMNGDGKFNLYNSTGTVYAFVSGRNDGVKFLLYQAAGDDFQLNYLRAPPILQIKSDTMRMTTFNTEYLYQNNAIPSAISEKAIPKAQGWSDYFKPQVFSKAERLIDRVNGTLDVASTVARNVLTGEASSSSEGESDGDGSSDDPDSSGPPSDDKGNPFSLSMIAEWLKSVLAGMFTTMKRIPGMISEIELPGIDLFTLDLDIAAIVNALVSYKSCPNIVTRACALYSLLKVILGASFNMIKDKLMDTVSTALEALESWWKANGQPKAQALADYIDFAGPIAAILSIVTFVTALARLPNKTETMTMINGLSNKLRLFNFTTLALSNVSKLYGTICDTIRWLVEWVVAKVNTNWLPRLALMEEFDKVEEWAAFVDSLSGENVADRCNYDLAFKNKVFKMLDKAIYYRGILVQGKYGYGAKPLLDMTTKAMEIGEEVKKARYALPVRPDPFCVCLVGPTSCGKSGSVTTLAMEVMDRLGYAQYNRWCPINCNEQFMTENYTQQTSVYWDDFSALETEEQYKNFFNMKANTQYPLNMAFRKGEYFNSDFIFMTTNIAHPQPNCVKVHAALLRRRDVLIQVDYATPELARLARAGTNVVREDMSHVRFRFVDPRVARHPLSDWMNIDDLTNQVAYLAREHLSRQRRKVFNDLTRMHYPMAEPEEYPEIEDPGLFRVQAHLEANDENYAEDEVNLDGREEEEPEEQPQAHAGRADDDENFQDALGPDDNIRPPPPVNYIPNPEMIANSIVLQGMRPEFIAQIAWDDARQDFIVLHPDYHQEYEDLRRECTAFWDIYPLAGRVREMNNEVKQYLMACSDMEIDFPQVPGGDPDGGPSRRPKKTWSEWLAGAKEKLKSMRKTVVDSVKDFFKKHEILAELLRILCGAFAIAFIAMAVTWGVGWIAHKCVCHTIRHFHYRCGVCGKWPELPKDNPNHASWLKSEWHKLYDMPYTPGIETDIDMENSLRTIRMMSRVGVLEAGTAQAHGMYANTEVKGQAPIRIMANAATAKSQATGPNQHVLSITNLACQRIYTVEGCPEKDGRKMSAIAIGGRRLLMPGHFFTDFERGNWFQILYDGAQMRVEYDPARVTHLRKRDAVIYEMPPRFHAHKDLTKHFISEEELKYITRTQVSLVKLDIKTQRNMIHEGVAKMNTAVKYEQDTSKGIVPLYIADSFKYTNIAVSYGDCGSPLITHSSKVSGVILGFHIAGLSGDGFATIITKEMLQDKTQILRLGTPVPEVISAHCSNLVPPGHFGRVGTIHPSKMTVQPMKTEIIPTEIHDIVRPHVSEPAVLGPSDPRLTHRVSPLRQGIAKYGSTSPQFPPALLSRITEWMYSEVERFVRVRDPQILTLAQAIQGLCEEEGYLPLQMNTSPGWPYTLTRPPKEQGKAYLFTPERDDIADPTLAKKFRERLEMAKRGERVESVWMDCLKDERRPLEKIKKGSTRVFTIPPVDFCLLARMYTLDFAEAVKNSRQRSFSQVGIDVQSLEWTELYKRLKSISPFCMAGDFTRYDGTIPPEIVYEIFKVIYYFYTGTSDITVNRELWNVLMVLCDEIIHTVTLAKDQVYVTHKGNPSGNPLTVIINSFVNMYYMLAAWLGLAEENEEWDYATLAQFFKLIMALVYGDDNLLAIDARVLTWFNQITVSAYLERFGIVYTNESKTGVTSYKTVDEASFLKNGFGDHPDLPLVKVPLMSKDTIYELLNWTRVAPDQIALLASNVEDSLRFAYFYGKEFFNQHRTEILTALRTKELDIRVPTWLEYQHWFFDKCGVSQRTPMPPKSIEGETPRSGKDASTLKHAERHTTE